MAFYVIGHGYYTDDHHGGPDVSVSHEKKGAPMRIYVRAHADSPRAHSALSESLHRVVAMHLKGYLPFDATVWINSDLPELGMWVLAEKSTHVRMLRSAYPGWVRLTRTAAKYARTSDLSTESPEVTYSIGNVPGFDEKHSTIVIEHPDPDATVRIVANSVHVPDHDGQYTFDPFTVIDLNHYTAPKSATRNPIQQAHAMINGVALLTHGYTESRKQFVNENIDQYAIEFAEQDIEFFRQLRSRENEYAHARAHEIMTQIKSATHGVVSEALGLEGDDDWQRDE